MPVKLTWTPRCAGDAQIVYRSEAPFSRAALPPPLVALDAQARSWTDATAEAGRTYWYAVAVSAGGRLRLSEAAPVAATQGDPAPLDFATLISARFAEGRGGVWFDANDRASLFQDAARTVPVDAPGQDVRAIADKSGNGAHTAGFSAAAIYEETVHEGIGGIGQVRQTSRGHFWHVAAEHPALASVYVAGVFEYTSTDLYGRIFSLAWDTSNTYDYTDPDGVMANCTGGGVLVGRNAGAYGQSPRVPVAGAPFWMDYLGTHAEQSATIQGQDFAFPVTPETGLRWRRLWLGHAGTRGTDLRLREIVVINDWTPTPEERAVVQAHMAAKAGAPLP